MIGNNVALISCTIFFGLFYAALCSLGAASNSM